MASTYTAAGIELIADGEQSTTWGDTTNTNWELMEELVAGVVSISLGSTTYTLTTTDGASSNGRHAVVVFTGSPGGTCTVTVSPNDMQKVYFVVNNSDQTVTLTQGSGANVSVSASKTKVVYCDGAGSGAAVVDISGGFDSTTLAELGVTASAAELNIMDGVTATTAELNILDGVTSTAAELNILDGVTATAAELNVLDGITSTTAELNILDGVTATATEINKLDGLTPTTTELNYVDGVTSAIQTQINTKAPTASPAFTGTPTAPTASSGTNTTQLATTAFVQTAVSSFLTSVYPVGSIYINAAVSTNPATLLGFGTWVAYGAGRVIVGLDSGQTEFDTLGETGGAKTHTLLETELPNHTHTFSGTVSGDGNAAGPATELMMDTSSDLTATNVTVANGGPNLDGDPHNNLQPYIVAYMWQRTA